LGLVLALVAGAVNAGGFMIIGKYTSHMTGILSSVADEMALAHYQEVMAGLGYFLAFLCGSICSTQTILWARRHRLHSEYALPLAYEAVLLLVFTAIGMNLDWLLSITVPLTVALLCFSMGFQNALITKISKAETRTTHMTGVVTDLGIELGRLISFHHFSSSPQGQIVKTDLKKLKIHASILLFFVTGSFLGAFGYKAMGIRVTLLFSSILLIVAMPNLLKDMRLILRRRENSTLH
jgi:uncharacterized membrane protein YoaK (UPF0700 family)